MGHVILDRRQEPRFHLAGRFRSEAPLALSGIIVDLSLNGALLECEQDDPCPSGELLHILLELQDTGPFAAQARVAHVHGRRIGIEFQEIEPAAFERLAELVLLLRRQPALIQMGGA